MPKFLLRLQGELIKEITAADLITIGRRPDNDVVIDSPAISGRHCKIVRSGDMYFIEDLYSTNGVFLNASKVVKSKLQNNDVIGIGKHVLQFVDDRPAVTAPVTSLDHDRPAVTALVTPLDHDRPDLTAPVTPLAQTSAVEEGVTLAAAKSVTKPKNPAMIRVLKGIVNKSEFELKNRSTFIGKSDRVQIRIKGTGLFGSGPESAAMISQHQEGYFLIPVKDGYVKLNGKALHQKELLRDGDVIQAGGTTLKFEDSNGIPSHDIPPGDGTEPPR